MKNLFKSLIVSLTIFFVSFGTSLYAATLSFTPSAGQYSVGQTLAVAVLLSSTNQSANAMSASLSFPRDLLTVTSISKAGSIVSLWATEPQFSNSAGTISFEGIIPNPGFQGAGGRLITIYFRINTVGKAPIIITNSSVLANDGQGTNILTNVNNAEFSLAAAPERVVPPTPTPTPPSKAPTVPKTTDTPPVAVSTSSTATSTPEASASTTPIISTIGEDDSRDTLMLLILLQILIFLSVVFAIYNWRELRKLRKHIRESAATLNAGTHKAFQLLKDDLQKHLELLETVRTEREWTDEEHKFVIRFQSNLKEAEKFLSKKAKSLK